MVDLLLQTGVNALYAASYLALVSVGLALIFGVMGVINFAHGEIYMLGAYAVVFAYAEHGLPFMAAVGLAALLTGMVGLAMERGLFRPLRASPLSGLIASIGLLLMLQALVVTWFGIRMVHVPAALPGTWPLPGSSAVAIPVQRLLVVVAAVLLLGGLWLFLTRSRLGLAMRACAQDPEAAALQGISRTGVAQLAIVIGAALAGVAGALTAPLVRTFPYMGHSVIVAAFIVIIAGGMGSLEGAIVAAVLYAFVNTFVTTFADGVTADIVGLLLMLLVLVVRPQGLFGKADRA
jgi:branched-chain amino acid transport system permease protein